MQYHGRQTKIALLVALTTALISTLSCGGGSVVPRTAYLYTSEFYGESSSTIRQYRVADNGVLGPIGQPLLIDPGTISLVVDPSQRYLFAVSVESGTIFQFVIGEDGTLSPNATPAVSVGDGPFTIAFSPDGRFAIVTCFYSNKVLSFGLNPSGTLTPISTVNTVTQPSGVAFDPRGRFAYVASPWGQVISEYTISSAGVLAPISATNSISVANLNYYLAVSPRGFLYSTNFGPPGSAAGVTEFAITTSGDLVNVGSFAVGSPIADLGAGAEWIAFDSPGTHAYVVNGLNSTVSQFTVDANGALTKNGADVTDGAYPTQIAIDPSGRFAFAASENFISQFSITDTGTLLPNGLATGVNPSPYAIAVAQR